MTELTQEYWEIRWQNGQTGWDIGTTSPALVDYCSRIAREQRAVIRVLIPGCGNGHEAVWLAENGFENVTMLDMISIM